MTHDPDHLAFWGVHEAPYDDTRNTRFFFGSKAHREALARMVYLVRQGAVHFGMLTGEVGAGKSITAAVLEQRISDPDRKVVYLPNCHYEFPHLLAEMIGGIVDGDVDFDTYDEYVLTKAFARVCDQTLAATSRQLVIIIDEAQELSDQSLTRLRNLTNLGDVHEEFHLTFILVGQADLKRRVRQMPWLDQRVALRFHLGYLGVDEVEDYLRHRLITAGHPDGNIFDPECFGALHSATKGVPRELNRFARLSMDNAWARQIDVVDPDCIAEIVADQRAQETAL